MSPLASLCVVVVVVVFVVVAAVVVEHQLRIVPEPDVTSPLQQVAIALMVEIAVVVKAVVSMVVVESLNSARNNGASPSGVIKRGGCCLEGCTITSTSAARDFAC